MNLTQQILYSLPATLPELRALFSRSKADINCRLCQLRELGLVKRSDRIGADVGGPGPKPRLWVRT